MKDFLNFIETSVFCTLMSLLFVLAVCVPVVSIGLAITESCWWLFLLLAEIPIIATAAFVFRLYWKSEDR